MSTYTKMSRRDFVREGFCPTLAKSFQVHIELPERSIVCYLHIVCI